jgi:uncharacterized protein YkwD
MAGRWRHLIRTAGATGVASLLAACGGGDSGGPEASAAAAAGGAPAAAAAADVAQASASTPSPATTKSFEDQILALANQLRASGRTCGTTAHPPVPALKWQAQTQQAAEAQARYLQQNNLFTHAGPNGSTVGDRLTATGYAWSTVGENIAAGQIGIEALMDAWIRSPGHCANLMNAAFVDIGVALVPGASPNTYRTYWGMVLARPR